MNDLLKQRHLQKNIVGYCKSHQAESILSDIKNPQTSKILHEIKEKGQNQEEN